jgi:hypothetical protein
VDFRWRILIEVEGEDCEIQKPQIWSNEDEEQMKDFVVNTILIMELQMINKSMSNNCKSEGFGMQRFEDDLLGVSAELVEVFAQSSRVFTQSVNFLGMVSKKLGVVS